MMQNAFKRITNQKKRKKMFVAMNTAAGAIQRAYRYSVWKRKLDRDHALRDSAVTIQRWWRMRQMKTTLRILHARQLARNAASSRDDGMKSIQKLVRVWKFRRVIRDTKRKVRRERRAALRIQEAWRRYKGKLAMSTAAEMRAKAMQMMHAALRIQKGVRALIRRRDARNRRKYMIGCAAVINRVARGLLARLAYRRKKARVEAVWSWLAPTLPREMYAEYLGFPDYDRMFDLSRFVYKTKSSDRGHGGGLGKIAGSGTGNGVGDASNDGDSPGSGTDHHGGDGDDGAAGANDEDGELTDEQRYERRQKQMELGEAGGAGDHDTALTNLFATVTGRSRRTDGGKLKTQLAAQLCEKQRLSQLGAMKERLEALRRSKQYIPMDRGHLRGLGQPDVVQALEALMRAGARNEMRAPPTDKALGDNDDDAAKTQDMKRQQTEAAAAAVESAAANERQRLKAYIHRVESGFNAADVDGRGYLNPKQFARVLIDNGVTVSSRHMKVLIDTFSSIGSGKVSHRSYVSFARRLEKPCPIHRILVCPACIYPGPCDKCTCLEYRNEGDVSLISNPHTELCACGHHRSRHAPATRLHADVETTKRAGIGYTPARFSIGAKATTSSTAGGAIGGDPLSLAIGDHAFAPVPISIAQSVSEYHSHGRDAALAAEQREAQHMDRAVAAYRAGGHSRPGSRASSPSRNGAGSRAPSRGGVQLQGTTSTSAVMRGSSSTSSSLDHTIIDPTRRPGDEHAGIELGERPPMLELDDGIGSPPHFAALRKRREMDLRIGGSGNSSNANSRSGSRGGNGSSSTLPRGIRMPETVSVHPSNRSGAHGLGTHTASSAAAAAALEAAHASASQALIAMSPLDAVKYEMLEQLLDELDATTNTGTAGSGYDSAHNNGGHDGGGSGATLLAQQQLQQSRTGTAHGFGHGGRPGSRGSAITGGEGYNGYSNPPSRNGLNFGGGVSSSSGGAGGGRSQPIIPSLPMSAVAHLPLHDLRSANDTLQTLASVASFEAQSGLRNAVQGTRNAVAHSMRQQQQELQFNGGDGRAASYDPPPTNLYTGHTDLAPLLQQHHRDRASGSDVSRYNNVVADLQHHRHHLGSSDLPPVNSLLMLADDTSTSNVDQGQHGLLGFPSSSSLSLGRRAELDSAGGVYGGDAGDLIDYQADDDNDAGGGGQVCGGDGGQGANNVSVAGSPCALVSIPRMTPLAQQRRGRTPPYPIHQSTQQQQRHPVGPTDQSLHHRQQQQQRDVLVPAMFVRAVVEGDAVASGAAPPTAQVAKRALARSQRLQSALEHGKQAGAAGVDAVGGDDGRMAVRPDRSWSPLQVTRTGAASATSTAVGGPRGILKQHSNVGTLPSARDPAARSMFSYLMLLRTLALPSSDGTGYDIVADPGRLLQLIVDHHSFLLVSWKEIIADIRSGRLDGGPAGVLTPAQRAALSQVLQPNPGRAAYLDQIFRAQGFGQYRAPVGMDGLYHARPYTEQQLQSLRSTQLGDDYGYGPAGVSGGSGRGHNVAATTMTPAAAYGGTKTRASGTTAAANAGAIVGSGAGAGSKAARALARAGHGVGGLDHEGDDGGGGLEAAQRQHHRPITSPGFVAVPLPVTSSTSSPNNFASASASVGKYGGNSNNGGGGSAASPFDSLAPSARPSYINRAHGSPHGHAPLHGAPGPASLRLAATFPGSVASSHVQPSPAHQQRPGSGHAVDQPIVLGNLAGTTGAMSLTEKQKSEAAGSFYTVPGPRPFVCRHPACGQSFGAVGAAIRHLHSAHKGALPLFSSSEADVYWKGLWGQAGLGADGWVPVADKVHMQQQQNQQRLPGSSGMGAPRLSGRNAAGAVVTASNAGYKTVNPLITKRPAASIMRLPQQ